MDATVEARTSRRLILAGQLAVLLGLCAWLYWPLVHRVARLSIRNSEMAHVLVAPVMLVMLFVRRRGVLAREGAAGSWWGVVLILFGLLLFAGASWPFSYGYARDASLVLVLGGVVLTLFGAGVLKRTVPMLLLVFLCIPVGMRVYASIVVRPEMYTMSVVSRVLDALPGVTTTIRGTDLLFNTPRRSGAIGLGQYYHWVQLFVPMAAVGLFVTFSRIRTSPRLAFVAVMTPLILLACNFLRALCDGLIVVYGGTVSTSILPRLVSMILAVLTAYGLFTLACRMRIGPRRDSDGHDARTCLGERSWPLSRGAIVRFVLAALALSAACLGLRPAIAALNDYYTKLPIAIRRPLNTFDPKRLATVGPDWGVNRLTFPPETLETNEYACIELDRPGPSKVSVEGRLDVLYFSQPGSKVPHTPDVCWRQGGAVIKDLTFIKLDVPGLPEHSPVEVCSFTAHWPRYEEAMVFCFFVEGKFRARRRAVRWRLGMPGNRYTYFAQIRASGFYKTPQDAQAARQLAKKLLTEALPILVREYFPTDEQIKRR